jgi:hypothetical protein
MKPLGVNGRIGGECPEAFQETRVSKQTATKFDGGTNTAFCVVLLLQSEFLLHHKNYATL